MSFKKRMKIKGNEIISQYSHNPYLIKKEYTNKKMPLWAKISIPSSLVTAGAIVAIIISNSLGRVDNTIARQLNSPKKNFNSEQESVSPLFVESIKDFTSEFFYRVDKLYYHETEDREYDYMNGNLIFSPISITNQLYMLYDGTTDDIREDISRILHRPDNVDYRAENRKIILNNAVDNASCFSEISTGMFIEPWLVDHLNEEYLNMLTDYYFVDVFEQSDDINISNKQCSDYYNSHNQSHLGFHNNKDFSEMVEWMTENGYFLHTTHGIDLIPCIYFESFWGVRFEKTTPMEFTNKNGTVTKNVSQMKTDYIENIMETQSYYIIRLPLHNYFFNILYPKGGSIVEVSSYISDLLSFTYDSNYMAEIQLSIPIFQFENHFDPHPILTNLCTDNTYFSFDLDKSFDDLGDKHVINPYFSVNASIELSELGLFGSASTDSNYIDEEASTTEGNYPVVELCFNKPFIYSITDSNELPLFVGQVCHM